MATSQTPAEASKVDHLEVRKVADKFYICDTLTGQLLGAPRSRAYWLNESLKNARQKYRPLIVRWLFGVPTSKSKELGITEGDYAA